MKLSYSVIKDVLDKCKKEGLASDLFLLTLENELLKLDLIYLSGDSSQAFLVENK